MSRLELKPPQIYADDAVLDLTLIEALKSGGITRESVLAAICTAVSEAMRDTWVVAQHDYNHRLLEANPQFTGIQPTVTELALSRRGRLKSFDEDK